MVVAGQVNGTVKVGDEVLLTKLGAMMKNRLELRFTEFKSAKIV